MESDPNPAVSPCEEEVTEASSNVSGQMPKQVGRQAQKFLVTFGIIALLSFSVGPRTSEAPLSLLNLAFTRSGNAAYAMLNSMGASNVSWFPFYYGVFILLALYLGYLGYEAYKESIAGAEPPRLRIAKFLLGVFFVGGILHIATDCCMIWTIYVWGRSDGIADDLTRPAKFANTCIIGMLIAYVIILVPVAIEFFGSPLDRKTRNWLVGVGNVFALVRPTIVIALIVVLLISFMDQSSEVMRVAAQDGVQSLSGALRLFLLIVMIVTFGLTNRFWAEMILIFHRASSDLQERDGMDFGYRFAPLAAGMVPTFFIGLNFVTASAPLFQPEAPFVTWPVAVMWIVGILLMIFSFAYSWRVFTRPDASDRTPRVTSDRLDSKTDGNGSGHAAHLKSQRIGGGLRNAVRRLGGFIHQGKTRDFLYALWTGLVNRSKTLYGGLNQFIRKFYALTSVQLLAKAGRQLDERLPRGWLRYAWLIVWCVNVALYLVLPIALPCSAYQSTEMVGPMTILLAGFTSLSATISIMAIVSRKTSIPILTALAVWCLLNAGLDLNDDHRIREMTSKKGAITPSPFASRRQSELPKVQDAFEYWLSTRPDLDKYWPDKPYPVMFIAAEGGGIRAAYQTAQALTQAETKFLGSGFDIASHTFVISGVSGGSVGAAVFASLVASEEAEMKRTADMGEFRVASWNDKTNAVLGQDLLSPAFAALLFGETLQAVWPKPFEPFDRARAQEKALERAWRIATPKAQDNPLEDSFYNLYYDSRGAFKATNVPFLVLNTTRVETGDRMIVSPFRVRDDSKLPDNLISLMEECRQCNPSLSTAAFLSARFPYVSPPGSLDIREDGSGTLLGKKRYADGGIYENSGAATLADIVNDVVTSDSRPNDDPWLREFRRWCSLNRLSQKKNDKWLTRNVVFPIIVRIGFDYDEEEAGTIDNVRAEGMNEAFAPLRTVLNTKDARGRTAVSRLSRLGTFVNVPISKGRNPLILGWLISKPARDELTHQISRGVETMSHRLVDRIAKQEQPTAKMVKIKRDALTGRHNQPKP